MSDYDREAKHKTVLAGLSRLGLQIKMGSNHVVATCPRTQQKTTLPRHNTVGKYIVGSICEFLIENGYDEAAIKKAFKW